LPQSLLTVTGFYGDWREWGLIRPWRREKLFGKLEKSEGVDVKGAEGRFTVKTGNWCRGWREIFSKFERLYW
jgi:hypothetical protein